MWAWNYKLQQIYREIMCVCEKNKINLMYYVYVLYSHIELKLQLTHQATAE